MQFHETKYGQRFLDGQLPRLIAGIENLAKAIEANTNARTQAPPPCGLCHVCCHFNGGEYAAACRDCVSNNWGNFRHKDDQKAPVGKMPATEDFI